MGLLIVFLGLLSGMAVSLPIITWFHHHPIEITGEMAEMYAIYGMQPIIPVAWRGDYILNQGVIVFFIVLLAIIYPLYTIRKLNVSTALRK